MLSFKEYTEQTLNEDGSADVAKIGDDMSKVDMNVLTTHLSFLANAIPGTVQFQMKQDIEAELANRNAKLG
jgi:hypothetical protein